MSTRTARIPRMPAIDGLRALAVAAVVVYHVRGSWLPGGFLGVDVFFVISGYLITSLLLAEHAAEGGVRLGQFWARRARRLLPALFLMLAVTLIVGATVERGAVQLRGDALAAIFYVANWRFVLEHQSYFDQFGRPPLLRHLWSLAVEEQFYLLWPPLLVLGLRLHRRASLPLLVAAATAGSAALMWLLYAPGGDPSRVFYGTDTRAAPLLTGVLLAFVWRPARLHPVRGRWARPVLDAIGVAALAGVVVSFLAFGDHDPALYRGGLLLLAACSALLLATVAHPSSTLARVLAHPVPRWIGERSYGIYLWHWPVLALTRPGVDVHLARGLVVAIQVAATLALAALSYRFVERPIRTGALRRLRVRAPWPVAQPRTPLAVTALAIAALCGLAALTPQRGSALPPGFTPSALAASTRATTHLVALPHRARRRTRAFPRSGPILALGDSVMLGAASALGARLGPELHLDAVVARQPSETIDRLLAYRAAGTLPRRVIVHIGDNGPVYYAQWQRLKAALAGVPLVVLVSVRVDRSWQAEVNTELRQAVAGWRHATVADWYSASARHGTVVDGAHTSPEGARLFAAVIARALHAPRLGGVTR